MKNNVDGSHADSGNSDIVLIPQPTECGGDPLVWLFPLPLFFTLKAILVSDSSLPEMVKMEEILPGLPCCTLCLCIFIRRKHSWSRMDNRERRDRSDPDEYEWRQRSELSASGEMATLSIVMRYLWSLNCHIDMRFSSRDLLISGGFPLPTCSAAGLCSWQRL